ncbi:MAG: methyltransferase domain-containing protein [Chloroflexota bacterium]|nr:methyltransferase domain-containing protein [Chloroflexota bacterium]
MPDAYLTIAEADMATQERLAAGLELRAADPQQRAMLRAYLADVHFGPASRVLEVGCGTGPVTRILASWPGVAEAVGIDPSPVFIAKARELARGVGNATFEQASGLALPFEDRSLDVVVMHTTLCHIPEPERALGEAHRVLRPGGWLAVFDGDYASTTLATGEFDPLQCCVGAGWATRLNDQWLVRRLPALVRTVGFEVARFRSHGYLQNAEPDYMLTIADRGADALVALGRIGPDLAAALKAEARRRAERGDFFGHIMYASLIARKSG